MRAVRSRSVGFGVLSAVLFALLAACSADSSAPLDQLPNGNWGGDGVGLSVDLTGVTILFNCAGGRIDHPLLLDANGAFDATGIYSGGGNTADADHSSHPARYTGHATRTELTITRQVLDRPDTGSTFTATPGAQPHVLAC